MFSGWDPVISQVTGDAEYTAVFTTEDQVYTVTWKNYDGTELEKDENVLYGTTPEYNGTTPEKQASAQYTYTFAGWDPEITPVSGDVTYTATYTPTERTYTITWKNYDGTELEKDENVAYGETPQYNGTTPTRPSDAQYSYTFLGWNPELPEIVAGDAEYTAVFSYTPVDDYRVYVNNAYGWDKVYIYYWVGDDNNTWPGVEMTADDNDFTYTAVIPSTAQGIIFNNGDTQNMKQTSDITEGIEDGAHWVVSKNNNSVLLRKLSEYNLVGSMTGWEIADGYAFAPVKAEDGAEEYLLSIDLNENDVIKVKDADGNWYPKGGEDSNYTVTSSGSYKIYFRPNANGNNDWHKYTFYLANVTPCKITWVDGDGRTIATDTVIYGETPEYTGETPTKTADAQYSYTFAGWSPEIGAVTGDMTYTATFNSTVNSYTITFENEDGTVLQSTEEEYGTTPEYTGETPTKTADAQSHYNWSGIWTPIISEVTGDAVYTAEFTPAPHTWGENPEWSFSSDNKSATATFTCSECGFTDSVTTTDITLSYGKNCCIYTAKAEFNGTAFKGQKSVECDPFIGHNLFLNGDIGINYYLNISDEDVSAGKVKVVFTWFDKEKIITVSESQKADDNLYKLACNVAPAEMTYDITANYYVDDVLIDSKSIR